MNLLKTTVITALTVLMYTSNTFALSIDMKDINNKDLENYLKTNFKNKNNLIQFEVKNTRMSDFNTIADKISFITEKNNHLGINYIEYGGNYLGTKANITVKPKYITSTEQDKIVSDYVDSVLANKPKSVITNKDKIKYVTDKIVMDLEYDKTLSKTSTYEAIINKEVVCEGYARLTKVFLDKLNIPNYLLTGKGNGEDHMWNMVKLENNWFHVDNTWNDPIFTNAQKPKNYISYEFFLRTDEEMKKTHSWDNNLNKEIMIETEKEFINLNKNK